MSVIITLLIWVVLLLLPMGPCTLPLLSLFASGVSLLKEWKFFGRCFPSFFNNLSY